MLTAVSFLALAAATAPPTDDFDWRKQRTQEQMHEAFTNTSRVCGALFGFTPITQSPEAQLVDKLYAYLLLRDRPDDELARWANILRPINAVMSDKDDYTASADRKAAAAAVAAAEDPSVFEEARARYVEYATAPFREAVDACAAGVRNPLLVKHYWTGTGSAAKQEREMADWFPEFVADLREKTTAKKP